MITEVKTIRGEGGSYDSPQYHHGGFVAMCGRTPSRRRFCHLEDRTMGILLIVPFDQRVWDVLSGIKPARDKAGKAVAVRNFAKAEGRLRGLFQEALGKALASKDGPSIVARVRENWMRSGFAMGVKAARMRLSLAIGQPAQPWDVKVDDALGDFEGMAQELDLKRRSSWINHPDY